MRLLAVLLVGLLALPAAAREPADFVYWPGIQYDSQIPSPEQALGHRPGSRITRPEAALDYLETLAEAAPDRMLIVEYGRSWEGRPLVYAIIGTPANIARLEQIHSDIARLADPRTTSAADADALIEDLPGTVWLSYSVHGNEISSTDAALLTAYHLLAGQDERTAKILDNTLVFIDPLQNPDGRARFVHHFEQSLGLEPRASRLAAEHDEPWPGGRTNHYLFDLNRDWFRISQPETEGRIKALRQWLPLVMVDAHEMGGDSTYFFAPEAEPYNPHLTQTQKQNLHLVGRNHARHFDRFGIDYFTREIYDAFYPGYGASWPSYYGGLAMTYEQGSARGLVFRRYDGSTLTYAEGVRNHYVASISTAEAVADNRAKLLRDFYDYRRTAVEEGRTGDVRSYIVPTQADQAGANELARLLAFHGIEVDRAGEAFRACGKAYRPGAFVVDLAQPEKRRARVLLDKEVPMSEEFVAEQKRRRAKDLPDQIYDVTAWSLPLMFNVEADACRERPKVAGERVSGDTSPAGRLVNPDAEVAFLVAWGEAPAARALSHALRRGLSVKSPDEAFVLEDRRWPAGTLILDVADNPADLAGQLEEIAAASGAEIVGVDSSWVTEGPSFGSTKTLTHPAPKVAIAWDDPTNSYSAGNTRFLIERRFDYPVTPIRTERLKSADLKHFDVLILPDQWGSYADAFGTSGAKALRGWIADGGVVVALGTATRWLADPEVDLLSIRRENQIKPEDLPGPPQAKGEAKGQVKGEDGKDKDATVKGQAIDSEEAYEAYVEPAEEAPEPMPGAILRAHVDPDHWLGAGLKPTLFSLVRGSDIYTPATQDEGRNVVRFAAAGDLVASGLLWEENKEQLAFKPLAVVEPEGRGFVVAITQDTTTRAYQDGLDLLFVNAVFRSAQHARPTR